MLTEEAKRKLRDEVFQLKHQCNLLQMDMNKHLDKIVSIRKYIIDTEEKIYKINFTLTFGD